MLTAEGLLIEREGARHDRNDHARPRLLSEKFLVILMTAVWPVFFIFY